MKKLFSTILLIAFCGFNLFAQSNVSKEDYAVYAAIINNIYAENLKDIKSEFEAVIIKVFGGTIT
jgi:hypothetical protein